MKHLLLFIILYSSLFSATNYFNQKYLNKKQIEFLKQHPIIKVSNEKDWAPYDYNLNGEAQGYSIDYLKMLSNKLGVKFVFVTDKWSNLVEKVKNKEIDIIHPLVYNNSRAQYLNFTSPIIQNRRVLVTNNSQQTIKSLEDLNGKRLAVVKGWNTTAYLKKNYPKIKFIEFFSSKEILEAVAFGEADATVDGYLTVNYLKQKYLLNNLRVVKKIHLKDFSNYLHIGVRKDWKILADILDITIKNLSDEEILSLNKKYSDVNNKKILLSLEEEIFLKNNPVIKVRVSQDYYPFSFVEDDREKGYIIEYSNLLAEKLGITFEYIKNQTWKEAISAFKAKELDVLPMMKETQDRKTFASFTSPILETYVGIATKKENIKNTTIKSLYGKKVAIMEGYWFLDNLKNNYPKIQTIVYKDNMSALLALKEDKVDAVISTEPVLQYLIKRNFFLNIRTKPIVNNPFFEKTSSSYAIRKDWKIFKDILQKAMNSLTEDEVQKIKKEWFLDESEIKKSLINFSKDEMIYLNNTPKIKMCIDPNWFPYEEIKDGKHIGISSDYFKIFQDNISSKIELIPTSTWTQTIDYAKTRKCDIISLAVNTPSRTKYLNFTKPYLNLPLVLATKLDKPFFTGINNSVLRHKFVVIKGYFHVELLKNKYPTLKLVEVNSLEEAFQKVSSGEAYGFIDSLTVIGHRIQTRYIGNLKIAGKLEEEFSIGTAIRDDSPELLSIFNKLIEKLTLNEHQQILNKWVSIKYEKSFDYKYLWNSLIIIFIIILFFIYRQYLLKKQNLALISTQKELENSLKEFEYLINSTLEAIFIFDDKKCIKANKEAIKLFKYKNEKDLLNINILKLVEEKYHNKVLQSFIFNSDEPYEIFGLKKDKQTFPLLMQIKNFTFRSENIKLVVIVDLTELRNKDKLLLEHSKMVALGEMIGNIAHQWRQPLSVISTAASGAKIQKEMNILEDEVFFDSMDGIVNNANYLSKTIDSFRSFILDNKTKSSFNLTKSINNDLAILDPMLKLNQIKIIKEMEEDITIESIPSEITQVIMNIITNAKDKFVEDEKFEKYIFIKVFTKKDKKYISIKDNAGGIPFEIIDKIFEPYFTTKYKNQGTGLGLYMTSQIITQSLNGTIEVSNKEYEYENKMQKGAEFLICL